MVLERIRPHVRAATEHTDDPAQHAAVVDLLVLALYSDEAIDTAELDALDAFDAAHADWDEGPFSVEQYLPVATAKVRAALDREGGAAELMADAASRIGSAALRAATIGYCEEILRVDGLTVEEGEFLQGVRRALASPVG